LTDLPSDRPPSATGPHEGGGQASVDALADLTWDQVLSAFDDLHYEQTAGYATAHWGRKKNSHLLVREGSEIVAGARVILLTIPSIGRGIAWVRFGPVWRRKEHSPDPHDFSSVLGALVDEYCTRRGLLLSVLPRPDPDFGAIEHKALSELGFVDRQRYVDWNHYFVDVTLDEDAQYASLTKEWRRNLKKALASDLDIRFCADEASFRQYASLHARMVERKNTSRAGPVHLLPRLRADLPESVLRLVLVSHQGQPVAGAVIARLGDTAYYIFGATSEEALSLRAGFALQWWIVRWLSRQGLRWYDLGGTAGNKGLESFKSGLSGRRGRIVSVPGEYEKWNRLSDRVISDALFALRPLYRKMSAIGLFSGKR
jgi:hypothetical protein